MTTSQKITLAARIAKHIDFCLENKMNLGDMIDYVHQDIDLNNNDAKHLFDQVFFSNYTFEQFTNN